MAVVDAPDNRKTAPEKGHGTGTDGANRAGGNHADKLHEDHAKNLHHEDNLHLRGEHPKGQEGDHPHDKRDGHPGTDVWAPNKEAKPWRTRTGEPTSGSLDLGANDPYSKNVNHANQEKNEHVQHARHEHHQPARDWHNDHEHLHQDKNGDLVERKDGANEVKAFKKDGTEVDVKKDGDHVDRTITDKERSVHTDGKKVDYKDHNGNNVTADQSTGEVNAQLDGTHVKQRKGEFKPEDRTKLGAKDEGVESGSNGVAYTHHDNPDKPDAPGGTVYKDSTMAKDGEAARYEYKGQDGQTTAYTAKQGQNGLELHRAGPDGQDQVVDTDKEKDALAAQGIQVQKGPDGKVSMTFGKDQVSVAPDGTLQDKAKQLKFKPDSKDVSYKGSSGKTVKVQGGPVQSAQVNGKDGKQELKVTNDSQSQQVQIATDNNSSPVQMQMQPGGDVSMDGVNASANNTSFDGTNISNDLSASFSDGSSWSSDGTSTDTTSSDDGSADGSTDGSTDGSGGYADGSGGDGTGNPVVAEVAQQARTDITAAQTEMGSIGAPPASMSTAEFEQWKGNLASVLGDAIGLASSADTVDAGRAGAALETQKDNIMGTAGSRLALADGREERDERGESYKEDRGASNRENRNREPELQTAAA